MADISTGRQRGIVPFVDETTGRLPDQYLPQGVIDLQGDLEQAVSDASQSATAAKASETAAKASADSATQSASAATQSAGSAQTAAESAASSKDAAAQSASAAQASAQAAETSKTNAAASASAAETAKTNAAASASAAETAKTNAAASASAAKQSETNAAASATAAQQAVDGFGLEVGTTTTGEPGTDAAVEIQKTGSKYTANFTIPRGDKGADGVNENVPLGSTSGVVAQAKDAYPALPRKVQVHGRTVENLWPSLSAARNGVTIKTDGTGLITVSGTEITGNTYIGQTVEGLTAGKTYVGIISATVANLQVRVQGVLPDAGSASVIGQPFTTSGTTIQIPAGTTNIQCMFALEGVQGQTVNVSFRVMLVEGDAAPDVFIPSGVHTVEPTKLVAAGKNLLSYPAADNSQFDGALTFKNEANGPVKIHVDMATSYQGRFYTGLNIPIPAGTYTISYGDNAIKGLQVGVNFADGSKFEIGAWETVLKKTTTFIEPKTITQFYFQMSNDEKMGDFTAYPMLEFGSTKSDWEACETVETELPSGISLADGDTLTIDRDGTTRILHAEGEPTVLDNVTLPELPAPTFNVYTTGGNVPPTVDVDYERDVNLALEALEAKIAALQVADKTN